jgi:cutinase
MIRAFVATLIATWALLGTAAPPALAQPCPDVEVVFARGTDEPPGVGGIGQGFVDALRAKAGARSVDAYAVNYAASDDFGDPLQFALSVIDGIRDASNHIQATIADCPNARIVLGGFSQGAAVAGFVTSPDVPPGVPSARRSPLARSTSRRPSTSACLATRSATALPLDHPRGLTARTRQTL